MATTNPKPLDPAVASILDNRKPSSDDDNDEDALFAALEEEDDTDTLTHLRERRLQQLHTELQHQKALKDHSSHGTYLTLPTESELLTLTTSPSSPRCVVHFKKPSFSRCRTMDAALASLAERHWEVRFVGIDVEDAPFVTARLGVKVLPCVIGFVEGVGVVRVVGFEGCEGRSGEGVSLRALEGRLVAGGVLVRAKVEVGEDVGRVKEAEKVELDEEDDDDWD